ncbi:DNA polymerase III subunit beta [Desulfurella sp.]|uniref:DNA polymerase III subunit beta n=1 Tax=Desulfurella sp. TaxID=1962857 RepID=UPI0025BBC8CE|nr:DNA polymerase III subunit beta [Desulfurella sp.]
MQFSIDASIIKKIIPGVSGGLSKDKNSILSNYHVSIKNKTLSLSSSNNIVQINITSSIESEGSCEFLAKPDLFERLKALNGEIFFELEDNLLTIKNGSYKTTAKIFDSNDYPLETTKDYKTVTTFDTNDILELLKAHIASSKDDEQTREFTGVLVEIDQNKVNFVATNRSRLFWINKEIENKTNFYCIIEKESILQLGRILKPNDKVKILYKESSENITKIAFQSNNATIISKVINGQFPQYQAVVLEDAQNVSCIVLDRESLKSSLQKVLALSSDELAVVEFDIKENTVVLNVTNKEGEVATDIVNFLTCEDKAHTQIVLNINGRYTMDFLNNVQSDSIYFYYKEAIKPLELKAISESKINYIFVMTPVR